MQKSNISPIKSQNLTKQILTLSLPIIGTFCAQKSIQFTNTFMLGHIGITSLAAGSIFMSFYMFIIVICMGIFNGVNILISREIGANNPDR